MRQNSIALTENRQLVLEIGSIMPCRPETKGRRGKKGAAVGVSLPFGATFRPQVPPELAAMPSDRISALPKNHLVFFLIDFVKRLDLSVLLSRYRKESRRGQPPYCPVMMLTLILYCYCTGTTSTRPIETQCRESIPCSIITGNQTPDHATIANFLYIHRDLIPDIFQQVLLMAETLGLVSLEHVALDGSKIRANASRHKAMSHGRMCEKQERLSQDCVEIENELASLLNSGHAKAAIEAAELKTELGFRRKRLEKIRLAKKQLERRVKAKAKIQAKEQKRLIKQGKKLRKLIDPKTAIPEPGDQINFTDPDSRIMGKKGDRFDQCYNVQIVVDSDCQIIVAHDVVQQGNDKNLLAPMLLQVHERLGKHPRTVSADSGYFSEAEITNEALSPIELLVPPDRESHPRTSKPGVGRLPKNISPAARMRRALSTKRGKTLYAQRKCIVEPVYGQVKESVLQFDQFTWRGLNNVQYQWALVCTAHNLQKIHRTLNRAPSANTLAA